MGKTDENVRAAGNRIASLALAFAMLCASLGTSIANIALPTLSQEFSAPFHRIQWVVIAYLAAMTVLTVVAGRLGDMFGLKRMLLAGLFLFSSASLLCALAANLWLLIAARALQGAGAAFMMTLTVALVRETTGDRMIGRTMGLLGTMSAVGTALGPSLGGMLLAASGWRTVFVVLVGFGLLAMALALPGLPDSRPEGRSPLIRLAALRHSGLPSSLVLNSIVAAVMMTTLVVSPFYLGLSLGLGDAMVGLVMSVGPVISMCTGIPSGRFVDAWGAQRVLVCGLAALTAGAFGLAILPEARGVTGYCLAMALLTPGYQLFQAANNTAVMSEVARDRRGTVSGLLSLSRNLGLILGASVMGAAFAFGVGTGAIGQAAPASVANGMQLTFILAGLLMILTLFIVRPTRAWRRRTAD